LAHRVVALQEENTIGKKGGGLKLKTDMKSAPGMSKGKSSFNAKKKV
jgi:hypothetical protein